MSPDIHDREKPPSACQTTGAAKQTQSAKRERRAKAKATAIASGAEKAVRAEAGKEGDGRSMTPKGMTAETGQEVDTETGGERRQTKEKKEEEVDAEAAKKIQEVQETGLTTAKKRNGKGRSEMKGHGRQHLQQNYLEMMV